MVLFVSDLDNTLIYSYKREIGKKKICVELYEGKEISFMTENSYRLLKEIREQVCFIPITTRSIEQYQRIFLERGNFSDYALVCNGGILLVKNEIEKKWYKDSLKMIAGCQEELEKGERLLERDRFRKFEIRKISDLFLFTKSSKPDDTMVYLKRELEEKLVDVCNNGEKIYIVPKNLNKGMALERIKEKIKADYVMAAGDSDFDVSMLKKADVCFIPKDLKEKVRGEGTEVIQKDGIFSDMILEYIKEKKCKR